MKFVLAPYGSRGDVEPMLALGRCLAAHEHTVIVCAPSNFGEHIEKTGLRFESAGADFRKLFDGSQSNSRLFLSALHETEAQFHALMRVAEGADVIVGAALQFAAPTVAEMLGVEYRYAVYSPVYLRSTSLPPLALRTHSIPAPLHRLLWLLEDAGSAPHATWLNDKRLKLGMSKIRSLHRYLLGASPAIGAFDPVLAPLPDDSLPAQVTGHWRIARDGVLPGELSDFLGPGANGRRAPVYLGFGSMRHKDSEMLFESLAGAIVTAGHRVVIGAGGGQLQSIANSADCFVARDLAHEVVFPVSSVAVHHGGAGTTLAAALSGVPQIVVPHLGDQFYHGMRVAELGLGPEPIPFASLTPRKLVAAIEAVAEDNTFAAHALDFAPSLREREGSAKGAALLGKL